MNGSEIKSNHSNNSNHKDDNHEEHIGKHLSLAFRAYEMFIDKKLKTTNLDLSRGSLFFLLILYIHGPMTQHDMSQLLYIDKAAINRTVSKLESQGYITKHPSSKDKRKTLLDLTDKAINHGPEIKEFLEDVNDDIKTKLSDEEFRDLIKLLQKLSKHLEDESRKYSEFS